MIIYLIKSSLCLAAFLLVYYLVFERENMHVFKRFYLLFSLAFSFVVPLISFEIASENTITSASNTMQSVVLPTLELSTNSNYLSNSIYLLYGLITLIFAVRFIRNLMTISKTRRNAEIIIYEKAELALVEDSILPHTFGSTIFINKLSYDSKTIETELFTHELTHVRQKHTLDVLFIEILKTIFWFNPLLILYKKAIQLNHEFLADEKVIQSHQNVSTYQQLLLSKSFETSNFYLTSNLNSFLKTKKRFIMMTTTTSNTIQLIKKSIVAPLFLGLFIFGSSITFGQVKSEVKMEQSRDKIYRATEAKPEFPEGIQAFYTFVGSNYRMPKEKDVKGKVLITFIVEKDGSLTDIKVIRDIGYGTGEEAVRVLSLSPKWIPGEIDGKPVRVQYSLPITIQPNS